MNAPSVKTSTASQLCPNPDIISRIAGKTRIPNLPSEPQFLKRNEHFCKVHPVFTPESNSDNSALAKPPTRSSTPQVAVKHSSTVRLTPPIYFPRHQNQVLFPPWRVRYVLDPNNSGYNGAADPFEANVDMGPVEPHSARVFSHSTPATSCWNSSTNLMTSKPLVSLGAGKTLIS